MTKKVHFLIDDVIWVLRDITRKKPSSLFDNPFIHMLKTAHEKYGVKTQLNLFYRTASFYGNDDFTLKDVPPDYKNEWEEASDWLKLAFHAKEEFPDYPHVNARYQDVKDLFETVKNEVIRFAGEKTFTYGVCPHWNSVSEEGVKALYDCGVRIMDVSIGESFPYNGDPNSLPYGHALRLLHNRQPETKVYSRGGRDVAINNSISAYNHLSPAQFEATRGRLASILDEKTGMRFKKFHLPDLTLNLMEAHEVENLIAPFIGNEYIGVCTHEQYFYEDYMVYQPDYDEKIYKMGAYLKQNGYEFIFAEELAD
ncbi:MAG: hypothetical protein E7418_01690 [Ruminococcaceae bacterium]|nr:hypothetical protein [Oscillospiraceae bacterium]